MQAIQGFINGCLLWQRTSLSCVALAAAIGRSVLPCWCGVPEIVLVRHGGCARGSSNNILCNPDISVVGGSEAQTVNHAEGP